MNCPKCNFPMTETETGHYCMHCDIDDYGSRESILKAKLGGWYDCGFELREPDDHLLELYFRGQKIANLNQIVTPEAIQQVCQNYWNNLLTHLRS